MKFKKLLNLKGVYKGILLILCLLLSKNLLSQSSVDDVDKGFYVGGGFSVSSLVPDTADTIFESTDDTDFGYTLGLGYSFDKRFFAEYDYYDLGSPFISFSQGANAGLEAGEIDHRIHALSFGWRPFNLYKDESSTLSPYIKAGACLINTESDTVFLPDSGQSDECDGFWGVGAELKRQQLSYRLSYDNFSDDISAVSLKVIWNFGEKSTSKKVQRRVSIPAPVSAPAPAPEPEPVPAPKLKPEPAPVSAVPKPEPVVDNDSDKDGVLNVSDLCPNSASDAKVESDGCIALPIIHFDNDSSEIFTSEIQHVETVVRLMQYNPALKIGITGHASADGATSEYNLSLSERRAKQVGAALNLRGINSSRISEISYKGDKEQICSNATEEMKRCNRRVEFIKS